MWKTDINTTDRKSSIMLELKHISRKQVETSSVLSCMVKKGTQKCKNISDGKKTQPTVVEFTFISC